MIQPDADLSQIVLARRRRPASRAACTAGSSSAISVPMMAITTSSSTSVKRGSADAHANAQRLHGTHVDRKNGAKNKRRLSRAKRYRGAISRSLTGTTLAMLSLAAHRQTALVGLLTSEPHVAGLLAAGFRKTRNPRQWHTESDLRYRSVTAAGPSRICTGVPCLSAGKRRLRPTTNAHAESNANCRRVKGFEFRQVVPEELET